MYRSPAFTEDDVDVLVRLARSAGFGHLVVATDVGPLSTPVPFVIADDGSVVRMHLARPNPVWRSAPCRALLIVPVTDAYVSPSWYPSKAEHGKVVPTWNYEIVHAHGSLVAHDDPAWVRAQIDDLTRLNEAQLAAPWATSDAPADFIEGMQRAIVGIELQIDRLEGKRKLSQNRTPEDRAGAAAGMSAANLRGAAPVANAIKV